MKITTLKMIRNALIVLSVFFAFIAIAGLVLTAASAGQPPEKPYEPFEVLHRIPMSGGRSEIRDVARIRYGDGVECVILLPDGGVDCW